MAKPLKVLILEDNYSDIDLMLLELERAGFSTKWTCVENREEYLSNLHLEWDLILSNFKLPHFTAIEALHLLQEQALSIPFIIVSDSEEQEVEIEAIKQGANDFLIKDRLTRLGIAVQSALNQKQLKKDKLETEQLLNQKNLQIIHYQKVLLDLWKENQDSLISTLQKVTEINAQTLGVDRVSIWLLNPESTELICEDLFQLSRQNHEKGLCLKAATYPRYFQALQGSRVISVLDAQNDLRTNEFTESYLKPLDIISMMDVPIRLRGKIVGVICHEQVKIKKDWTLEEQDFAASVADLISLALVSEERKITEDTLQKKTEELERSNKELKQFSYVVSHDLQEPLRTLISFGELLLLECPEQLNDTSKNYIQRMRNAALRMQQLLVDLFQFSRVVMHNEAFFEEVDLAPIFEDVKLDLRKRISDTAAQLEIDPNIPKILADKTQMYQLFQNLLVNSLKFSRKGLPPQVSIKGSKQENGSVEITVSDNGIGFEEQYLDLIFKPFQRLHLRGQYEGTGMGLAICKKIVERHGGEITARSKLDQGSSFIVSLPAAP